MTAATLIEIRHLSVEYEVSEGRLKILDDVNFDIHQGSVTAVIGESGSGKSTLSNAILGLLPPNGRLAAKSEILFGSKNMLGMTPEELRLFRWRKASLVFQAAQSALNPVLSIRQQLLDTVSDHGDDPSRPPYPERLERLLGMVQLEPSRVLDAYPHQLSGGMRQRVIIALALLLQPELVILDEPTTALDVISQSCIFDILEQIHAETHLTMLFITHDLGAVSRLADRVGVMYAGTLVEEAPTATLFEQPRHPYTRGLFSSMPSIDGTRVTAEPIPGQPPQLLNKPGGCIFHPRCSYAQDRCSMETPSLQPIAPDHQVACLRAEEIV